jgi:hypothetical protein
VAQLTVVYGTRGYVKNSRFVAIGKDFVNADPFACTGYGTRGGDALNEFSSGYFHLLIYLKRVFTT